MKVLLHFKKIDIICLFNNQPSNIFYSFKLNVCCLSSQVHLPHAKMSWQICFLLHYETKQIFSWAVVHVYCLSFQIHPPRQYRYYLNVYRIEIFLLIILKLKRLKYWNTFNLSLARNMARGGEKLLRFRKIRSRKLFCSIPYKSYLWATCGTQAICLRLQLYSVLFIFNLFLLLL